FCRCSALATSEHRTFCLISCLACFFRRDVCFFSHVTAAGLGAIVRDGAPGGCVHAAPDQTEAQHAKQQDASCWEHEMNGHGLSSPVEIAESSRANWGTGA